MTNVRFRGKIRPEFIYTLVAIRRDSNGNEISRRESPPCPNVFTNQGVEQLFGVGNASTSSIAGVVGTGSSTPSVTDTTLQSFLAGRYTSNGKGAHSFVDNGDGTGYVESRWTTVFGAGVATGNISEVGSAFANTNPSSSTVLCSRALVVDSLGNPTTFEVLADEELQLNQYFRRHINLSAQTMVMNVNGTDHTLTWQPAALGGDLNYYWDFPFPANYTETANAIGYATGGTPVTTLPSVMSTSYPTVTGAVGAGQDNLAQGAQGFVEPYVAESKKIRYVLRYPTGSDLLITFCRFIQRSVGSWNVTFNPAVPKSALERFTFHFEIEVDNTP